jgi:hypothetical protein
MTKHTLNGLRHVAELAADRPHGDRLRYMAGCRCKECRAANTAYETQRALARKAGDWNGVVSAARARSHIAVLSAAGVGRRQVSDASGVGDTTLSKIIAGDKTQIRARTERAILAVTTGAAADHALVDARATWVLLHELLATGYTRTQLAHELGNKTHALQIGKHWVTVRNAFDVQRMHQRLRRVPVAPTSRVISDLREEGYRLDRIHTMAADLAKRDGLPVPDLQIHGQHISAAGADLLARLHQELTEVPA